MFARPSTTRRRSTTALLALLAGVVFSAVPAATAHAEEAYVPDAGGSFTFAGHGWGHGHGLSQYGAQGAASLGVDADAITAFYYPGTAKGSLPDAPVRVLLSSDEGVDTQVFPATGLIVTDAATGTSSPLPSGPSRWRATVAADGLHVQSLTGSSWTDYSIGGRTAQAGPVRFSGPTYVRLAYPDGSSRDYRGAVSAVKTSATTLVTVDVLGLEDYLLAVVPRESSSSWKPAALQAQAIAARSYSAYKRAHVPTNAAWDICDSTACQVFGGSTLYDAAGRATPLEATTTSEAVRATAGVVRTYGGAPIFAEFSSSNGGWSTDGGQPYLRAQQDDWDGAVPSSVHSWSATVTATQLQARFPAVGTLRRLRVTARDGHGEWGGRVSTVVLEGVDGAGSPTSVTTTGAGVYGAHSWPASPDGLRSSWWTVTSGSAPSDRAAGSRFVPVAPVRLLDTRLGTGAPAAQVGPGGSVSLQVAGVGGLPTSGVTAVVLNVTAVAPTADGYITAYPSGASRPTASNLNTAKGVTRPNLVVVQVGDDGRVVLFNSGGNVHLLADLAGWYGATSGSSYVPLPPRRVLDTRTGTGAPAGVVGPGATLPLTMANAGGVPAGATAVVLNVTAVQPSAGSYVTVYPTGQSRPNISNLNPQVGSATPNLVVVPLGDAGRISLYNSAGTVHLVADVAGYFLVGTGAGFTSVSPSRLLDTRHGIGAPTARVGPGGTVALQVSPTTGVPAGVTAVVLNVTAVAPSAGGYVTAYPDGTARPMASNLNTVPGRTSPNLVVVQVGSDGKVALYNSGGQVDLVADLAGYYTG